MYSIRIPLSRTIRGKQTRTEIQRITQILPEACSDVAILHTPVLPFPHVMTGLDRPVDTIVRLIGESRCACRAQVQPTTSSCIRCLNEKGAELVNKQKSKAMRLSAIVLMLICSAGRADTFLLDAEQTENPLNQYIQFLEDPQHGLSISDIQALPESAWTQNKNETLSRGYSGSTWWVRISLHNTTNKKLKRFLEISYPVLDYIDAYVVANVVKESYRMGDKFPFHKRPVHHRYFLIPLEWTAEETFTVYLAVRSSSSIQVPVTLWERHAFYNVDRTRTLLNGIYYGIMLVMIMYNLFVYLAVGERNYLYYVLFVTCMPLFLASLTGYSFQYLWPNYIHWNDQAILVALSGVVLFGGLFTYRFLNLDKKYSLYGRAPLAFVGGAIAVIVLSFYLPYRTMIYMLIPLASLACMYALVSGAMEWKGGNLSARYYTVAWTALLAGGVSMALNKFHVIPKNTITDYATQIGSALEVVLLSFALAERINQERRLRFDAQQDMLNTERELRRAREEALDLQKRATESLELRVKERTLELEGLNQRLEELSATDQLTGLKNRRFLDQVLVEEYARCTLYGHFLAILLMDVDHFKRFNDTYGHLIGDECLKDVAGCVQKGMRWPSDRAARYGGEEFCVVLPETNHEGARIVAERIRHNVEQLNFFVKEERVQVTISVGVAVVIPNPSQSIEVVLAMADSALYKSKELGRNRVTLNDI